MSDEFDKMNKDFWKNIDKLEQKIKESSEISPFVFMSNSMLKKMIYMLKLQKKYLDFCDEALEKYNE